MTFTKPELDTLMNCVEYRISHLQHNARTGPNEDDREMAEGELAVTVHLRNKLKDMIRVTKEGP